MTARAIDTSVMPRARVARPGTGVTGWGARLIAGLLLLADAWVEAQEMARAAHERNPFVDW